MFHNLLILFISQGGVVLVSHDERLIELVCKELLVCKDKTVREYFCFIKFLKFVRLLNWMEDLKNTRSTYIDN